MFRSQCQRSDIDEFPTCIFESIILTVRRTCGPTLNYSRFTMPFLVPNALSYLFLLGTASSTCYFPNGIPLGSSSAPTGSHWFEYQPCNPDPNAISMCCTTNRTSDRADTCLPNGLCSGWTPGGSTRAKYRESCTDPDWSSRACLKDVCTDPSVIPNLLPSLGMTGL